MCLVQELFDDDYRAVENPHWMMEANTHPQKINVWAGIVGNRIIEPNRFDRKLGGEQYLNFL